MTGHRSPATIQHLPDDADDDDRLIGRVLSRREVLALMGFVSVGAVAAACSPGSVASGSSASGRRPSPRRPRRPRLHWVRPHRPRRHLRRPTRPAQRRRRERPSVVCRRPGAHGRTLLRQRKPRALRHPGRYGDRQARRWLGPEARLGRVAGRWQRLHPARGRSRRRLALRRAGGLLRRRRTGRAGTTSSAAISTPTPTARRPSRRSTPAGTRAARSTSISRSARPRRPADVRVHIAAVLR